MKKKRMQLFKCQPELKRRSSVLSWLGKLHTAANRVVMLLSSNTIFYLSVITVPALMCWVLYHIYYFSFYKVLAGCVAVYVFKNVIGGD